jgi:hypothetical protein
MGSTDQGRSRRRTLADMVKTNTFVTDYEEFAEHPDMRMRYFGPATPTSAENFCLSGNDY